VSGAPGAAPSLDGRGTSPLRWLALGLAAAAIFSSYYESDAIGPIADMLYRQRGLTQFQIGDLTAVISLPNILLALVNGVLIDRFGAARVTLWAALIGFGGAVLTAIGEPYDLMWLGRFIFGVSEGAIFISLIAGLAQWFSGRQISLAAALFLSFARIGSYSLDKSPRWAHALYEGGWQPPLWLGAAITGLGLVASLQNLDPWVSGPMIGNTGDALSWQSFDSGGMTLGPWPSSGATTVQDGQTLAWTGGAVDASKGDVLLWN